MESGLTGEVLDSATVTLCAQLIGDNFQLTLEAGDVLAITPRSRLTSAMMADILAHKAGLKRLAALMDPALTARVVAFQRLHAATPAPRVPAFLFRLGVPYQPGVCFSC